MFAFTDEIEVAQSCIGDGLASFLVGVAIDQDIVWFDIYQIVEVS